MKPKFYRKVLKNGMVVILEKRDIPVVSVAFAVRQGGINESEDEKGLSHFIEHMLYKGTPTRNAQQIAREIELNGGELNGFTTEDVTAFWCKMPSKHLDVALDVLSDMVKNPLFDKNELEKERKVIFEEMKMYKDSPRMHVFEEIHRALYHKPFGIPLIGTKKSMKSITKEFMLKKFKEIYTPNNMILCVVGDANWNDLVKYVEKNFNDEKGKLKKYNIKLKNNIKIEKRKGIDQANLVFAFHSPLAKDKKSYAAHVLMTLMAGGMSSRLFSEIREKRNLAYAVKGEANVSRDYSFSLIYVGTTEDKVNEVKRLILEEFKEVAKDLGEEELRRVKEQLIGNYQISMEDSQAQLIHLLGYEIESDASKFYEFEKEIKKVNLKDVKELASRVKEGNYSFYALIPSK
jgi:predicted Zn-dependent peptidase